MEDRMRSWYVLVVIALVSGAGCSPSSQSSARAPLTERQRDSVLAKSILPGAPVVGRALDVSDHATDRSAELAAADSLFR
jgi:hypothetical protein